MRRAAAVVAGVFCVVGLLATLTQSHVRAQDASTYRQVENWAQPPDGKPWGQISAVGISPQGDVYAFVRAEPSFILVFDSHGKYVKTFGDNSMMYAHGLSVTHDGTIWATDRKVQMAFKFNPEGKVLMTLGQKDVAGNMTSTDSFNGVSDVAVAENGDLFISDGEGANTRVVKFSKDGKYIMTWGTKGSGPGQLETPHNIAIDSKGNIWVADRGNKRVQEFDKDGNFLNQMTQFGTPVSIAFDKNDVMYVADGAPENQVVIGTTDGKVLEKLQGLNTPHGIAVSPDGNTIYVAETGGQNLLKFVKK
jgi:DNA-binding beta-propeller fold protein YncE